MFFLNKVSILSEESDVAQQTWTEAIYIDFTQCSYGENPGFAVNISN